jgi:hypothetical protein
MCKKAFLTVFSKIVLFFLSFFIDFCDLRSFYRRKILDETLFKRKISENKQNFIFKTIFLEGACTHSYESKL